MKFKINKIMYELMGKKFDETDTTFLELDPVFDTATQAIYDQQLRNKYFNEGLEYGYKEGFYDGSCPEKSPKYCNCSCKCRF